MSDKHEGLFPLSHIAFHLSRKKRERPKIALFFFYAEINF